MPKTKPEQSIEAKLDGMGLVLPEPVKAPPGARLPYTPVRVRGKRAIISGHGPQNPDGSIAGPLGKVGAELTLEQGYEAARLTALSILQPQARTGRPGAGGRLGQSFWHGQLGAGLWPSAGGH